MMPPLRSIVALLLVAAAFSRAGNPGSGVRVEQTPEAFVAALYKQHETKTPFFQAKDRAALDKWFAKPLADLIWKDATTANGEVGAIDGDPLYDAQDMDIKDFEIHPAKAVKGEAKVHVTFTNYGKKRNILFTLEPDTKDSWKITDIGYEKDRTLLGELKSTYPQ
ncbi:MAG: DUF3828 domain-containing protein [Chthoniobacterales bacterium]